MRPTNRRGSNAIEFALTVPLFVAMVTAIIEFGWMFFMRSTVIHAVRDGCRAGAVIPFGEVPSPTEVAQAIRFPPIVKVGRMLGTTPASAPEASINEEWLKLTTTL